MWIEWNLAVKLMREGKAQSWLILIGIAVGVAVLVFLTALITGLQANIIQRTLGTQAHLTLAAPTEQNFITPASPGVMQLVVENKRAQRLRSIHNWQEISALLDSWPQVVAVAPLISGPAFVRRGEALQAVVLMGIDVARYQLILPLQQELVAGSLRLGAGDAVIGKQLAQDLGLQIGDKLRLDGGQERDAVITVTGVFQLGVRELDSRYVYVNMQQAQALLNLPGAASRIDLKVADLFTAQTMAEHLSSLTGLKAESWMQTNLQLMNALRSQSIATQVIGLFVALSVALGIASVLSISVVQLTREIGILRAMGTRKAQVLRVFLIQGGLFGLGGAVLGCMAGYALVSGFNFFGPKLFYVALNPWLPVAATFLATLTGVLAAALPAQRAAALNPVEAIRHV